VDFGNLRSSIQGEMTGPLSGVVFTDQEYAPTLELGGAHIAPRPFLKPAAKKGQRFYGEDMRREMGEMK
jgi:hypothetical protein